MTAVVAVDGLTKTFGVERGAREVIFEVAPKEKRRQPVLVGSLAAPALCFGTGLHAGAWASPKSRHLTAY